MTKSGAERLLQMQGYGFWVRTKTAPYRAVKWDPQRHEDGRQSFRGRNWVEVLPHGIHRAPERFFTADVEAAGPHEWLSYYPPTTELICGWGDTTHTPVRYCPRKRTQAEPFCRKHMAELTKVGEEDAGEEAQRPDAE